MNKILIAAGGTGGHIIPALAVAKLLQTHGLTIIWLGTRQGLEHQLVPAAGIAIDYIDAKGLRKKRLIGKLLAPLQAARATFQALRSIRNHQPVLVIGFGGFVSGPAGLAAWLARKPLVIHEQNAVSGLTNRCLAHLATRVFQAFPQTFKPRYHPLTVGNPVRTEIITLPNPTQRLTGRTGPLRLLILGGSQGATALNETVPQAIATLLSDQRPEILHSAGQRFAQTTTNLYQELGIKAQIVAYISDMAAAYEWADLVICRAGALTIAELAAAGIASLLVPYPFAVDDHQTKNATWLVKANAALCIPQSDFTVIKLANLLKQLTNRPQLLKMSEAAHQLALPLATTTVVEECLKLINAAS